MKETDIPFLHLFHGSNSLEQPEAIEVNNELITFPISPSPPKGLIQNFPNVMKSFEPYTNYGVPSKDQNSFNDFNSFSYEGLPPLAPTVENGTLLRGFSITNKPFWSSQILNFQSQEITPQNHTNPNSTFNFMDLGYSTTNSTSDQNGQDKRKMTHTMREASKAPDKVPLIKGKWTPHEDSLLKEMVETHGIRKWSKIAKMLSGRVGKQCRERWHNNLRPDIKKDAWTEEEDMILIMAHEQVGNKWVEIARRLPGRSENSIKNHWNAAVRKKNNNVVATLGAPKKNNKKPNFKGSLLLNYVRSILNNVVAENSESSSQAANDAALAEHDYHADPQMQLLPENSDMTFLNNWVVNPVDNLVYNDNDHDKSIFNLGMGNDNSLASNSYGGFKSYIDELAAMEEERNMDFQMRSEIESLMKGPAEVKKEMDLMEMIRQGKI